MEYPGGEESKDFDDLIHILASEIRLITPTDPQGKEDDVAAFARTREFYAYPSPPSGEGGYTTPRAHSVDAIRKARRTM